MHPRGFCDIHSLPLRAAPSHIVTGYTDGLPEDACWLHWEICYLPCSLWSWSQINWKTDEDCITLKNKSGNLLHVLRLLLAGSFFVLCYPPLQSTCTYTISAELPRRRLSLPNQPLLWVIISLGYTTGIHAVLAWQQAKEMNTKDEEKEDPISQLQHCNYIVIFFLPIQYAMTDKGQGQG